MVMGAAGPGAAQPIRTWRSGDGAIWRALLAGPAERERHDAFVRSSPRGNPLQLWSFADVKRGDGWEPLRLLLERNGRTEAALSLVEKSLAGGRRFWLAHRGPVANPAGPETPLLWEAVRALAATRSAFALRCDPEWPAAEGRLLQAAGFVHLPPRSGWYLGALQPLRTWRISLAGGVEAVLARCEPHTRYDVRRALRKGVVVRPGTAADLPAFHALQRAAATRKSFSLRSVDFFTRLWRAWEGDGQLFIAEYGGTVVGGAWFVCCGGGCWGQFAAADLEYRRLLPTVALYWAGIRWALERGCTFCDLGGIGHIPDPQDGLWAFKKGFGPGDTRFGGEYDLPLAPAAYAAFRLAEEARWAWSARRERGQAPVPPPAPVLT